MLICLYAHGSAVSFWHSSKVKGDFVQVTSQEGAGGCWSLWPGSNAARLPSGAVTPRTMVAVSQGGQLEAINSLLSYPYAALNGLKKP